MKVLSNKKRAAAIGAVTAATLVGGTVAFAYWTTSGTGTGSATTAAGAANLEITSAGLTPMYPGDSAQPLVVTVTNKAASQARVAGLTATVSTNVTGCDEDDFLINGSPAAGEVTLKWTAVELTAAGLPGAAQTTPSTGVGANTIQFNNKSGDNQDACKAIDGVTKKITITYEAS
jgi:hypothetical protein